MSAEKTLEILDLFKADKRELTVPEMASLVGIPTSTAYRHVRILKGNGYVMEKKEGIYQLGYKLLEFATIVRMDLSISEVALPEMRRLTNLINETTILTILSGENVICLETVTPEQPIKVSSRQGKVLPFHAGASSKALVAFTPIDIVEELIKKNGLSKCTEKTVTDIEVFKRDLEEIRNKGYVATDEEVDIGVFAYGVPIRDVTGKAIAALSIAGPRDRLMSKNKDHIVKELLTAAKVIQKNLPG
ncbi:IclR family transcriptional regulator [Halalkalibacter wakoensis]|nr:IclR family transcriptional regulator [Halalkalibacter wakoensis]